MVLTSIPIARAQTSEDQSQTEVVTPTPLTSGETGNDTTSPTTETPPADDATTTEGPLEPGGDGATAAATAADEDAPPTEFYQQTSLKTQLRDPERFGTGEFSESVAIEVPKFRGLEPKLALSYSSSGGLNAGGLYAGLVGVGWRLEGIPDIVRTAPVNGAPRFNENDVYQLDGMDLVPCAVAASPTPSCGSGGTHATKVESYSKIVFDASNADDPFWTVWAKDGTRSIFKKVSFWGGTVDAMDDNPSLLQRQYRWLLAERIDTRGNTVSYRYICRELPVCYPEEITYNKTSITFRKVDLAEPLSKATGRNLAILSRQLKRIEITTDGAKVRLYALSHEASASTSLQRLTKVELFGKDFVVGADGVVAGTKLPAWQFTYTNATLEFTPADSPVQSGIGVQMADFDGDRLVDSIKAAKELTLSSSRYITKYFSDLIIMWPSIYLNSDFTGTRLPDLIEFRRSGGTRGPNPADGRIHLRQNLNAQNEFEHVAHKLWSYSAAAGAPFDDIRQTYIGDFRGLGFSQVLTTWDSALYTWNGSNFDRVVVGFDNPKAGKDSLVLDVDGDGVSEFISKDYIEDSVSDVYIYKTFEF